LAHAGREGLARHIARHNALARYLERRIEALPDLELHSKGSLSIVCFRCRPPNVEDNALDALNKQVMEQMQSQGIAFLTSASLRAGFVLRACILHYGTTEQDIDVMLDAVRRVAQSLSLRF
jgi:aromatic-L-amino-acid/L-tryptophan decarboxylase